MSKSFKVFFGVICPIPSFKNHSKTFDAFIAKLACGKFALRALSQCLAEEFQPQGIHVAHVILDGVVRCERLCLKAMIHGSFLHRAL